MDADQLPIATRVRVAAEARLHVARWLRLQQEWHDRHPGEVQPPDVRRDLTLMADNEIAFAQGDRSA